jgi:hypothetical protein
MTHMQSTIFGMEQFLNLSEGCLEKVNNFVWKEKLTQIVCKLVLVCWHSQHIVVTSFFTTLLRISQKWI